MGFPYIMAFLALIDALLGVVFFLLRTATVVVIIGLLVALVAWIF
jgi:hypothetical protein